MTAYWALDGSSVTSFSLPLEIEVDNAQAHVIPAVLESGAWRPLAEVPGTALPASWSDGFAYDGTNVRILTRHLSLFTLLEDAQAPTKPGGFKGNGLEGQVLALLDGGERQLRPDLRLPGLRERRAREDGRRLRALRRDGQVQADRQALVPGRRRGRAPATSARRPSALKIVPEARQADARSGQVGAEEARLQDRQDHVQRPRRASPRARSSRARRAASGPPGRRSA